MVIKQFITLYTWQREEDGKIKLFGTQQKPKAKKYGKAVLFNRPPMVYMEVTFTDGTKNNTPFERTGPDEYTEVLKG